MRLCTYVHTGGALPYHKGTRLIPSGCFYACRAHNPLFHYDHIIDPPTFIKLPPTSCLFVPGLYSPGHTNLFGLIWDAVLQPVYLPKCHLCLVYAQYPASLQLSGMYNHHGQSLECTLTIYLLRTLQDTERSTLI